MSRFYWLLLVCVTCLAGLAGLSAGMFSDRPREIYEHLRYTFRESLGLEKFWVALPTAKDAEGRKEVECPDPARTLTVLTGGQSNGANVIPVRYTPINEVSVWFNGRCYEAADPVLGTGGPNGSLWSMLGDALSGELNQPVLLINTAVAGSQVGDWTDERSGYYNALLTRVKESRAAGYEPKLIVWHQGETDAKAETHMDVIQSRLGILLDRMIADMPESKLYLFVASKCVGKSRENGVEGVREAERLAGKDRERVMVGLNTDELGNDLRWDTCHFNSFGRKLIVDTVIPDLVKLVQ